MTRGIVYLVGAGPGDAGLITQRGLACLRRADVVVYDRLIGPSLLAEAPLHAERICAAKTPGNHRLGQSAIEEILVREARRGRVVVRLKGGDPFVLGRGGEEALTLKGAGIPFEVVPGISSALAVPAAAGIPVTQRHVAGGFAVWTAHRSKGGSTRPIDAPTQVILMGVGTLQTSVDELLALGRPASTPVAVISWGTTVRQRSVFGTLADIVERVETEGLQPPATVVVGEVVRVAEQLQISGASRAAEQTAKRGLSGEGTAEHRLFAGKRVVLTRTAQLDEAGAGVVTRLKEGGAEVTSLQVAEVQPDPQEVSWIARHMSQFDMVLFTDPVAVRTVMECRLAERQDGRTLAGLALAAVGEETERALRGYGLVADAVLAGGTRKSAQDRSLLLQGETPGSLAVISAGDAASVVDTDIFAGVEHIRRVRVARTHPAPQMIRALVDLMRENMVDAVLFDSERSLRWIREELGSSGDTSSRTGSVSGTFQSVALFLKEEGGYTSVSADCGSPLHGTETAPFSRVSESFRTLASKVAP